MHSSVHSNPSLAAPAPQFLNDAAMLPRLTALLALALGLLRIAALSLHPDKLLADAPFSLADEVRAGRRRLADQPCALS